MSEQAAPAPAASNRRQLLRRLPILLAMGALLFLWNGGFNLLPAHRELSWLTGDGRRSLTSLEIQLYGHEGALLKREEFFYPRGGAPAEIRQEVSLKEGTYRVDLFVGHDGNPPRHLRSALTVGSDRQVVQTLPLPPALPH